MPSTTEPAVKTGTVDEMEKLEEAQIQSKLAWKRLRMRIISIDPTDLARLLLIVAGLATLYWVIHVSWSTLLPFQIGIEALIILLKLVRVG